MAWYGRRSGGFVARTVGVTNDVGRVWLSWSDASGCWVVKDASGDVTTVPSDHGGMDRLNFKPAANWAKWRFPRMTVILDSGR